MPDRQTTIALMAAQLLPELLKKAEKLRREFSDSARNIPSDDKELGWISKLRERQAMECDASAHKEAIAQATALYNRLAGE